jgi:hypothetical protein
VNSAGVLNDADRELRRVFRLTPDATSTTIFHLSSGTVLSDWSGRNKNLNFGGPSGIGLAFSISSVATNSISVTLRADLPVGQKAPDDAQLLGALSFYAINHADTVIPLIPATPWRLVGVASTNGPNTYTTSVAATIDPAHVGALVKLVASNSTSSFNVVVSEVQLRGRDLFECDCTLRAASPAVVRNLDDVTTSDTISFGDDGMPSLSDDSLKQHLDLVKKVESFRAGGGAHALPWLLFGRELFEPLLLTSEEGPAFDDFVFCYAFLQNGSATNRDFIGDFLGLTAAAPTDANIVATFDDMTGPTPRCTNQTNPPHDRRKTAYATLRIEMRELVHQRDRLHRLIETASRTIDAKYAISEEATRLFTSLSQVKASNSGSGQSDSAELADSEIALGIASVVPGIGTAAGIANEGASLIGDVLAYESNDEMSKADTDADDEPEARQSADTIANTAIVAETNAETTLEQAQKKQQNDLKTNEQGLDADIPMLAETFRQMPDDASTAAGGGVTGDVLISEKTKWDLRAAVWSRLLPLKVALIGRPLLSRRKEYGAMKLAKDAPWTQWLAPLDAKDYGYDAAELTAKRNAFRTCLDGSSCDKRSDCTVAAPDSPLDKNNFLFFSQTASF